MPEVVLSPQAATWSDVAVADAVVPEADPPPEQDESVAKRNAHSAAHKIRLESMRHVLSAVFTTAISFLHFDCSSTNNLVQIPWNFVTRPASLV